MEYIAFDAHKHYTLASVVRPDGRLVREQRLPHELPEARPLIATSPDITIMPPMTAKIWLRRNGSMRLDPLLTSLSRQTHACPIVRIGPARSHGPPHSRGACESLQDSPVSKEHRAGRSAFRYGL